MNNNLVVFEEREVLGKEFRIYGDKENPLFLAKDVANWIEHSNTSKMLNTVDEDEKRAITISYSGNMTTNQLFLTEDGLYEVLMQSRKPIAKAFKKEVKQILKQIRLTGGSVVLGRESEFINNYFPTFSEEVKLAMVSDLYNKNIETQNKIKEQQQQLEVQAPKVETFDKFIESANTHSITDAAKLLGLKPRKEFIPWLIEKQYLTTKK